MEGSHFLGRHSHHIKGRSGVLESLSNGARDFIITILEIIVRKKIFYYIFVLAKASSLTECELTFSLMRDFSLWQIFY